jgi:uncharacterized protein (TIGR04255 family)
VLDIDVFREWSPSTEFQVEYIDTTIRTFAEYAHSVFRWATTDEFIRRYRNSPGE